MIFPSEMSRIHILTHNHHSDKLVELLHESGLMEISHSKLEGLEEGIMHPDVGICASRELQLTRIIDILKKYEKKKKGIKAALKPSTPEKVGVKKLSLEEKISRADELLKDIESFVIDTENRIGEIKKRIEDVNEDMKKMESISPFDIDVSWLGKSRYLVIKAGITENIEELKESLRGLDVYIFSEHGKEKGYWIVILVAFASLQEEIEKRIKCFDEIEVTGRGNPVDALKNLSKEKRELEKKKKKLVSTLREIYRERRAALFAVREEIKIEKRRKEISERFGRTAYTSLIEGWCLSENEEKLEVIVKNATDGEAFFSSKKAERSSRDAPIHLKMPKWADSFRTFLELFSLPKYNEINPSMFMGVSFIIFFAIMLGDAGYGLVILLISFAAYAKLGKYSSMIKNWSFLGIWLGLSTVTAGILFNGFFGDFIPRFIYGNPEKAIYSAEIAGIHLPIDALHKPLVILIIALIIGLIHLNLGFIIAIYQNYKIGNIKNIFKGQVPWFLLQIGGGALVGSALLHIWELSTPMEALFGIFTAAGLIMLFVNEGPIGFFGITGFTGDWLSYARLLALGLATAGMALAFNIVADLMPKIIPYIGVVLLPIVLVVAHLANLLIQSLGAAIHSLRLQYVEFFNRFYEGGGKKFSPFHIERKYTEEIK